MNGTAILATIIVVVMTVAGTAIYVHYDTSVPGTMNPSSLVSLHSGTVIPITLADRAMYGGAAIPHEFYGIEFNLSLNGYYIITGSWESTGKSLVLIVGDNEFYAEFPLPDESRGILNQTLLPSSYGNYTLIIGGYPGDVIRITRSIEVQSYTPSQVGSLSIPAGTEIYSPKVYSSYLDRPCVLVGSFTTGGGTYSYSFSNSPSSNNWATTSVTNYNSSAKPAFIEFNLSQNPIVFGPGNCSVSFGGGTFYVNQTLLFLFVYDDSSSW